MGFLISFNVSPSENIAIISLSLLNFKKLNIKPNNNINGMTTFIKLGIMNAERKIMLIKSIWKVFIIENNLEICNNQEIETNIKKTSVQDLII